MGKHKHQTARIWADTLRRLKLIAVYTNECMVAVMDRLAREELKRLNIDDPFTQNPPEPDA